MSTKKRILVIGATGSQGGSVVKYLQADGKYIVRAFTRDINGIKAENLRQHGIEVVAGDLGDKDSLLKAMENCYGVFGLTNYWVTSGNEAEHGKNLIDSVKEKNIQHFVFHTLKDYTNLSHGKFPVAHCDSKAKLQEYAVELGVPATFVQIAFYYENFLTTFRLELDGAGQYFFGFPQGHTKLAMASVEDTGAIVTAIFNNKTKFLGRTVGIVGEDKDPKEYAKILSSVLDKDITYKYIPKDVYASQGEMASYVSNMFEAQRLYLPNREDDYNECKELHPGMQTLENWAKKNKKRFEEYFESVEN